MSRARPRPLSSSPWVKTPSKVDFPESTFPRTATRRSRNCEECGRGEFTSHSRLRFSYSLEHPLRSLGQWKASQHSLCWEESVGAHLLIVRNLSHQHLSDLPGHVTIIIHFSLPENSDVCPNPVTEKPQLPYFTLFPYSSLALTTEVLTPH